MTQRAEKFIEGFRLGAFDRIGEINYVEAAFREIESQCPNEKWECQREIRRLTKELAAAKHATESKDG